MTGEEADSRKIIELWQKKRKEKRNKRIGELRGFAIWGNLDKAKEEYGRYIEPRQTESNSVSIRDLDIETGLLQIIGYTKSPQCRRFNSEQNTRFDLKDWPRSNLKSDGNCVDD